MVNSIDRVRCIEEVVSTNIKEVENLRDWSVITQALSTYADRPGCLGCLVKLLLKIWNAFKSLCGCSDWQRAQKVLERLTLTEMQRENHTPRGSLKTSVSAALKSLVLKVDARLEELRAKQLLKML